MIILYDFILDIVPVDAMMNMQEGGQDMRRKMKRRTAILLALSLALLTACGSPAEEEAFVASIDDEAVSRSEDDYDPDNKYIDEEKIALADEIATAEGALMAETAAALVNEERAEQGLTSLTWSDALTQAAAVRAQECETSFSHTRPDGTDWWTVNSDLMYGENLAYNYNSAAEVVEAWMNSEGHRANILKSSYTTIGIACYQTAAGKWYWAQEFGYF